MALLLTGCGHDIDPESSLRLRMGDRDFRLELALTPEQRSTGLSDRPTMPDDAGMIFVFPDSTIRVFSMIRCHFPIDLIYLSPKGRIVDMHAMQVEPPDVDPRDLQAYVSRWPAQFAIEIHGGLIEQLGLQIGQQIDLPVDNLKTLAR
jgi:uncharacterized membrane protein (UPF0127 family)